MCTCDGGGHRSTPHTPRRGVGDEHGPYVRVGYLDARLKPQTCGKPAEYIWGARGDVVASLCRDHLVDNYGWWGPMDHEASEREDTG